MSDREAFVSAIAANPDDDLPRLVFADWLEENGDPERADFIRTQIRWHHAFPDERKELDLKADKLFREHWLQWFGPLLIALEPGIDLAQEYETRLDVYSAKGLGRPICSPGRIIALSARSLKPGEFPPRAVLGLDVCRGFIPNIATNLEWWKEGTSLAETFRCEPVSELCCRNGLFSPHWERFTEPVLRRVERLSVYQPWAWHDSAPDSTAFLEDPHLVGVRHLDLWAVDELNSSHFHYFPVQWLERFVRSSLAYQITSLSLNCVNAAGVRPLCRPGRLRLEQLELIGDLNAESVRRLGASELAATVHTLDLGSCCLEDIGAAVMARDDWRRLTHLKLTNNKLTAAVLPALASAAFLPQLKKLDLSGNPLFDGTDLSGLQRLADSLDPDRLEHLDLTATGLSSVPEFLGERFGERVTV